MTCESHHPYAADFSNTVMAGSVGNPQDWLDFKQNSHTFEAYLIISNSFMEKCAFITAKAPFVKGANTFDCAVFTSCSILVVFCVEFGENMLC